MSDNINRQILIEPVFPNSPNAILLAANDGFAKYMAILIQSIIDYSNQANYYDIVVLHKEITSDNCEKLHRMIAGYGNISLRIINVYEIVSTFDTLFIERNDTTLSEETYYRLLAPDVFSQSYDRVVYLDGDMVFKTDIAELYDVDIDNYYLAASRDVCGNASCSIPNSKRLEYRSEELKLACTDDYFIAGLLIMNLQKLREDYPDYALMKLAASRNWLQHDQDVLNFVCRNRGARILHSSWNVLQNYGSNKYLKEPYYTEWLESERSPKVIHYGGSGKPFKRDVIRQEAFWKTAAKIEFFPIILREILDKLLPYKISEEELKPVSEKLQEDIISGKVSAKYNSILSEIAESEVFALDSIQSNTNKQILSLTIEKSKMHLDMETKRDERDKLQRKNMQLIADKDKLAKDNRKLRRDLKKIKCSKSFKLGRIITKIPRKICNAFRRITQ